jgi:hypothetical protein
MVERHTFFTAFIENANMGLTPIQGLGGLTKSTCKTIVHESELENTLESFQHAHLALRCSISRDLDLLGLGND